MQPQMLTLPIHEGDKIFTSKLLSRETTSAVSSRTMYYGRVQSSIPFGWESHPGTPKTAPETNPNDIILTLTPPPSLYCSNSSSSMSSSSSSSGSPKSPILKNVKGYLISPNRRKGNPKRGQTGSSSSSSSSSLSSLSPSSSWSGPVWSSSAPRVHRERHRRHSLRSRLKSDLTERNFNREHLDRPKSTDSEFFSGTPKFVGARKRNKLKGCFVATTLKRAVLAVVGRRSGNRDT